MERIYTIKLDNGASYLARGDEALALQRDDMCVIRKEFYNDFGVINRIGNALDEGKGAEMPVIVRKAALDDIAAFEGNHNRERAAMRAAQDMVSHLGLPMKLLNAHYTLDAKFLTIQFTADGRVDFRELVKELSRTLGTRIELRQIGVRDESAIHGGISVCGQILCCCRFLKEFNSINVRMAKDQDLSLTPATISGVCGRLKCCLKFEHEGYLELEKNMPRRGDWCECESGRGRICDRNLLTQEVTVQLESGNQIRCKREDIRIVTPERRPFAPPPPPAENNSNNAGGNGNNAAPRRDNGKPRRDNDRRDGNDRRDNGNDRRDNGKPRRDNDRRGRNGNNGNNNGRNGNNGRPGAPQQANSPSEPMAPESQTTE